MTNKITITECPRDAMHGIKDFIPTDVKIKYLNQLLKVGFTSLDFGSFVSPKAIPQMKDSDEITSQLEKSNTKLLAIVANTQGAETASKHDNIDILGFPFSISEEFQLRNTNSTRSASLERVSTIKKIADSKGMHTRIYLSMAFGNPYKEDWNDEILLDWAKRLTDLGISELVLSDTVGVANEKSISSAYSILNSHLPTTTLSGHFHSTPNSWESKITAGETAGCTSFDSAILGKGGCPMAEDDLVGNIATENLINHFKGKLGDGFNASDFTKSLVMANSIFNKYH